MDGDGAWAGDASRRRIFIVTAGRTGSSLLSAILADCGANFAMPAPPAWDPRSGQMEDPDLCAAADYFKRAHDIAAGKPGMSWRRVAWSLLRSRGKTRLAMTLAKADYVKCVNLDLLVHPAFRLGYAPTVILSYRRFEDYVVSSAVRGGHSDLSLLTALYTRIYQNGLLQMTVFGGCVVAYEQLVDPDDVSWANALASVTRIPAPRLIAARERYAVAIERPQPMPPMDRLAGELFTRMEDLRGRVLAPSPPYLRELAL